MSKAFNATLKFTDSPQKARIYVGAESEIHCVFVDEHYTLYYKDEVALEQVSLQVSILLDGWTKLGSKQHIVDGLRAFALLDSKSCLMGEMKPTFSDMTFEEWCSEEQIAKEFYAYQERLRKKRR